MSADTQTNEIDERPSGKQYLTFVLDGEEYAVDILKVQEIKSWGPVTPIPCSPSHVLGVINLRGAIVPVVDLRSRFGLDSIPHTATTAVVIVRSETEDKHRVVGLVVDQVAEVYHIDYADIQDSNAIASKIGGEFIGGLGKMADKLVILIELDNVVQASLDDLPADVDASL